MNDFVDVGGRVNRDGTLRLYHATTVGRAVRIRQDGVLRRPSDAPDSYGVYFSSSPTVSEDYGDGTLVEIDVDPSSVEPDDWFPGRRMDFHAETRGGSYRPVRVVNVR